MFQLKKRDAAGRIADWIIKNQKITTPTLAVVVSPNKQDISPKELKQKFKAELIITNAYIIKNSKNRKTIEEQGLHKFYDWNGPIYTDSGTFQMYSKGSAKIGAKETIQFQQKIGSDIITPLDEFTLPTDTKEIAEEKLKTTIARLKEAKQFVNTTTLFNGPIQGGIYSDLRIHAAKQVNKINPDIYSIGGIVPLMEQYRYKELVETIISVKKNISVARPVHAFGCGHPMIFSLLVSIGIDVFDSAAYSIFAKKGKYMTESGTLNFNELEEFPCSCPICSTLNKKEFTIPDLARHNLYVTFRELRTIREAIRKGTLWDLVETRVTSHPMLYDAYIAAQKHNKYLSKQEPISKKRAYFYLGPESKNRPEIYAVKQRIKRVNINIGTYKWMGLNVPSGMHMTYPFGQCVIPGFYKPKYKIDSKDTVRSILQFQFGKDAKNIITNTTMIEKSKKTKRIRRIWDNKTLLGTLRAHDGFFIPTITGASRIRSELKNKDYSVVVDDDVSEFAKNGKNVFARFVKFADKNIRPGDVVFVTDSKNELLACGLSAMNKKEMKDFDEGVAVHVKHSTETSDK
ncbi:tRNA guanosine(15) transglycosylase TgtA [archaeon]|nr:tRNA guanosine(15) transglycosylase TgtA [archaeon]